MKAIPWNALVDAINATDIIGWFKHEEAVLLYDHAAKAPGPVVEIGTYMGMGSALLAAPGKQPVTTIDPHDPALMNATQVRIMAGRDSAEIAATAWEAIGVAKQITQVKKLSQDAAGDVPAEIGLLFVDGCHYREAVESDLRLYAGRVVDGGFLIMHDWGIRGDEPGRRWGVQEATETYMAEHPGEWTGPKIVAYAAVFRRNATEVADGGDA